MNKKNLFRVMTTALCGVMAFSTVASFAGCTEKKKDSITEVASMVGFSSPSYYSQIFKRYMKCTPMEYKK